MGRPNDTSNLCYFLNFRVPSVTHWRAMVGRKSEKTERVSKEGKKEGEGENIEPEKFWTRLKIGG